jgi:hypothetical protein
MNLLTIDYRQYQNAIRHYCAVKKCNKEILAETVGVPPETLTAEIFEAFSNVLKVWDLIRPGEPRDANAVLELIILDPKK